MIRIRVLLAVLPLALTSPVVARDSLGIWNDWGAFRDGGVPRCYAIAMAEPAPGRANDFQPYVTVGIWPTRGISGEVHARLSRRPRPGTAVTLSIGGEHFTLQGGESDAWSADPRSNAAIIAALRSAGGMTITTRDRDGHLRHDTYRLSGAASAIDAATLGCARR